MGRRRPHNGNRRRGSGRRTPKQRRTVSGTLVVTRPGSARVETAEGTFDVVRGGLREGMNGDLVEAVVVGPRGRGHSGPCAVVSSVTQRAVSTFLGRFEDAGALGVVVPLDARLGRDFFVLPDDPSVTRLGVGVGDVVRARIVEYPTRRSAAVVTLEGRVGSADELDLDVESVIASFGLAGEFPASALEEAEGLRLDVEAELTRDPSRHDLRDVLCVTVDPSDARDFDDAVSARRMPDGGFELGVHIADVAHYVRPDGALDNEAKRRTCSAYLVDRVIPMLPERLCNDVCSLVPQEDRLAMSVFVRLDAEGRVRGFKAMNSAVRSAARLDYDTVDALLEGRVSEAGLPCEAGRAAEVAELLRTLDELRGLREDVRRARGAIDFSTVEAKVVLDDSGRPRDVCVRRRTRATGLIEEAMLVANECVAGALADRDAPAAYRVHEQPSPDDLKRCVPPLQELGVLDAELAAGVLAGEPHAIQAALARSRGTDGEYTTSALLLRAQKRAVYMPSNQGHYALGAKAYCHFTSPIRRYPDVLVHRALKALLAGKLEGRAMRAQAQALPQLCRTCSELERVADAAGRMTQKVKMAELYEGRVGERVRGVVSGCTSFGVFVTLDGTAADALLPVRGLGHDWFVFDEARLTLTGESTGRVWRLGQRVEAVVAGTCVSRGQIDLQLPEGAEG